MTNNIRFDHANCTIIITKKALDRADRMMEPEYSELCKFMAAQPTYKVVAKAIKTKSDKKTYHGLSIDQMKNFIKTKPNSDERLKEFAAACVVAEAKGAKYPLIKKWFLENYADYTSSDIVVENEKNAQNDNITPISQGA